MRWRLLAVEAAFAQLVVLGDDGCRHGLPRRRGARERRGSVGDRLELRRAEIDIGLTVERARAPGQPGRHFSSLEQGNRHDPDTENAWQGR